ncbi:MAG: release factor glutamine methyltransferase, partial [Campylobacterota bacterium]|nr:release factor glutamine methyltransferase [Campylobacterota bacterium]
RINFVKTSYLNDCKNEFDLLVSNPPYIANNFELEKHLMREPSNALFGGEKGDEIIKNIIDISIEKNIKTIAIEMGYDQKESLSLYLNQKNIKKVSFYKDLAGLDRGFVATISSTGTKND